MQEIFSYHRWRSPVSKFFFFFSNWVSGFLIPLSDVWRSPPVFLMIPDEKAHLLFWLHEGLIEAAFRYILFHHWRLRQHSMTPNSLIELSQPIKPGIVAPKHIEKSYLFFSENFEPKLSRNWAETEPKLSRNWAETEPKLSQNWAETEQKLTRY